MKKHLTNRSSGLQKAPPLNSGVLHGLGNLCKPLLVVKMDCTKGNENLSPSPLSPPIKGGEIFCFPLPLWERAG